MPVKGKCSFTTLQVFVIQTIVHDFELHKNRNLELPFRLLN